METRSLTSRAITRFAAVSAAAAFVVITGLSAAADPTALSAAADPSARQHAKDKNGWTLPATASEEKNPMTATPQVLAAGRALFRKNCQRCHGPTGVGDGPDADPDYMADMDLTNPAHAADNPDGVVFYKVWNGRQDPKMPAFKNELTRDQVWTIVTYVQTLRGGGPRAAPGR